MSLSDRIDALLPLVSKPTRYLGNEFHAVRKTPGRETVQWCLVLPEVYEIGMSHWGLKILYEILNRRDDALAERAYAPWFDMEARMRAAGVPLFSLESRRPLRDFDLVGFSLQYELTYTNLLNCLDLAGIPLRSEDRRNGDPLIAAGGPCASNPEPLSDFVDFYLIGDGEEAVPAITDTYKGLRGRPRAEILRELSKVPGVYVPAIRSEGARVQRQFVAGLEEAPWPELPLVPLQEVTQDRLAVEVLRGCTRGCRFCQAGYFYRPVRERSVDKLLAVSDRGIRDSGWDELGLVSLSTGDYTQLEALAGVLNARFHTDRVALSLPSLRADSFGVAIAERVGETRRTGFTFAPEAGSERLRLAMNKAILDKEFFQAAEIAYSHGWRLIKMYFMVGLPTETWKDVEGIARFVDAVRRIGRDHGASCSVNASVGSFVPKSHTPLQWDAFEEVSSLREKIEFLKGRIQSRWSRLKWHHPELSHLEAVFSMGDRRLGRAIEHAFRSEARFDGWTEHFSYDRWLRAFEACGIDPEEMTRARSFDEPLPWDHIDCRISKKWLVRERKKVDSLELTADCRHGECSACGIPGLPQDAKLAPALSSEELRRLLQRASALAPSAGEGGREVAGTGAASLGKTNTGAAGTGHPARFSYEKRGPARFLSHLEMISVLERAFRMARVGLVFSQGHKPHPRLSFGPPLSVGVEGLCELFDAVLAEPWSEVIPARLNGVLPEGVRMTGGRALPAAGGMRRASLSVLARTGRYVFDLSKLAPEIRSDAMARIGELERSASLLVERTSRAPDGSPAAETRRGGKPVRLVDLKQAVVSWQWLDQANSSVLLMDLRIENPAGHTANPRVILEGLFRLSPERQALVPVQRSAFLDERGDRVA